MEKAMQALLAFRDARDWKQFHNHKDLAVAISVEASELLAEFLWKSPDSADRDKVKDELSDILSFCLLMAHGYGFDPEEIVLEKVARNMKRYPVEKSRGNAKKHNEL